MVFASKVDGWLKAVLLGGVAFSVGVVLWIAARGQPAVLFIAPIVLVPMALPIWILRSTFYTLTDSHLDARSGPFSWRIPLQDIRAITPTRNPLSSPALSLDRLRIDYGRGGSLMISPADKQRFISELIQRCPALRSNAKP